MNKNLFSKPTTKNQEAVTRVLRYFFYYELILGIFFIGQSYILEKCSHMNFIEFVLALLDKPYTYHNYIMINSVQVDLIALTQYIYKKYNHTGKLFSYIMYCKGSC